MFHLKAFPHFLFFALSSENKTRVIITLLPPLHIICEISHISLHTFSTPPYLCCLLNRLSGSRLCLQ